MSGNRIGGIKARNTNKEKYDKECMEKYGMTYYQYIGQLGGVKGKTGGFASNKVGADGLTGKERARVSGMRGGKISRRKAAEL